MGFTCWVDVFDLERACRRIRLTDNALKIETPQQNPQQVLLELQVLLKCQESVQSRMEVALEMWPSWTLEQEKDQIQVRHIFKSYLQHCSQKDI